MFGLKEAEVAQLVRAVAGDDLDRDAIEDRFARASWSGIAEPGDRIAGELIEALGAPRALSVLIQRMPVEVLLPQLAANAITERDLRDALARWAPRVTSGAALVSLRQAARYGVRLCTPDEADWPSGMWGLNTQGPVALWVRGTEKAYRSLETSMALVGARAATGYGEHVTMEAPAGLVDRGYTIVSGAAYGIDGMAHRAALASHGLTVAFLAGGVDRFYPSGHDALLERIVQSGAVISELPCGAPPTKWRFLQRNRLIAATPPRHCRSRGGVALRLPQYREPRTRSRSASGCRARSGHECCLCRMPQAAARGPGALRHQPPRDGRTGAHGATHDSRGGDTSASRPHCDPSA